MRAARLAAFTLLVVCSANAAVTTAADPVALRGVAAIATVDEHMIGVVIDEPPRGVRHLFRLWTCDSLSLFRLRIAKAVVEFHNSTITVMDTDEQRLFVLGLPGSDIASRSPEGFTATYYAGYGVNHETRLLQPSGADDCLDCFVSSQDFGDSGAGGGGGSCDSGGPGTMSCSVTQWPASCSASCRAGYYACCSITGGCRCIKN